MREQIDEELKEKMQEAVKRAQMEAVDAMIAGEIELGGHTAQGGGTAKKKKKREAGKRRKKNIDGMGVGGEAAVIDAASAAEEATKQAIAQAALAQAALAQAGLAQAGLAQALTIDTVSGGIGGMGGIGAVVGNDGVPSLGSPVNDNKLKSMIGGLSPLHKNLIKGKLTTLVDQDGSSSPTVNILKAAAGGGSPGSEASQGSKARARAMSGRVGSPDNMSHGSRKSVHSGGMVGDRSPSPTNGVPKKLSIIAGGGLAGVAGMAGGAMSPLNALKAKRQSMQAKKGRKSVVKRGKEAVEEVKPEVSSGREGGREGGRGCGGAKQRLNK